MGFTLEDIVGKDDRGLEVIKEIAKPTTECYGDVLVVELGDAYIEFDDDASTSSMYIPQDEGYFDDGIWIGSKISIIRGTSTNVRIRGIIWGR